MYVFVAILHLAHRDCPWLRWKAATQAVTSKRTNKAASAVLEEFIYCSSEVEEILYNLQTPYNTSGFWHRNNLRGESNNDLPLEIH